MNWAGWLVDHPHVWWWDTCRLLELTLRVFIVNTISLNVVSNTFQRCIKREVATQVADEIPKERRLLAFRKFGIEALVVDDVCICSIRDIR